MKNRKQFTYLGYVLIGTLVAGLAVASDKETGKPDPKMEEMMKKVEEAGTPGPSHKALEPLVGNWNTEVKCWMDPAQPPMISKGTSKSTWTMNGRFVQEEFSGEFMGKPFRGMSLTGYDNTKKKYETFWVDEMHTAMFKADGTAENDGKVITLTGKMDCPITGQKDMSTKQVLKIISNDKHVLEMYDPLSGNDQKSMEITYTRK